MINLRNIITVLIVFVVCYENTTDAVDSLKCLFEQIHNEL